MVLTYGAKCGISELSRASFRFEVNPFRFSSESKLIHLCWRSEDEWRMGRWSGPYHWELHRLGVCFSYQSPLFAARWRPWYRLPG